MKEYKGWEIAKMICEGTLKDGDMIENQYEDTFEIKNYHLVYKDNEKELGSSYFGGDFNYKIVPQPVSFEEAINFGLEGKMIKVKHYSLNDSWNDRYFRVNKIFEMLSRATLGGIPYIIKEGKWYIKESEVE